jgi:hypothetical protein
MGNGIQALYVEHVSGYLKFKEGSKKQTKNYLLCCVSGMNHRPEFEVGSQVAFCE